MKYKEMLEDAKAKGLTSEKVMWESIEDMDDMLCMMKHEHPKEYWALMRRMHGRLYKHHYDEEFARWDIEQMHSTDPNGIKHIGAHWSKAEVVAAMQGHPMPAHITECDKWVAANAMWHDLHRGFDDKQIILATILFFFGDEDWGGDGKIWCYMNAKRK